MRKIIFAVLLGAILSLGPQRAQGQIQVNNVAIIKAPGNAYGVAAAGNYVYVADDFDGLRIYDVSDAANPTNVGYASNSTNGGGAIRVVVSGGFAYVANYSDGLRIYDVSNPSNPVNVGHAGDATNAFGVAVSGNYAYVANQEDGVRIYNITDPSNPLTAGHIDNFETFETAESVAISGHYAYVANYLDGLHIYDISDPTNPTSVSETNDGGYAQGVAVSGNYCYVASNTGGLHIYDISNPAQPGDVFDFPITPTYEAVDIAISGNYAFLAENYELVVLDITTPASPQVVADLYSEAPEYTGIAVAGPHIYLAGWDAGWLTFAMAPQLTMGPGGTNTLSFSWPAPAAFTLQQKTNLRDSVWVTLTNTPVKVGSSNAVTITQPATKGFFRLISE